MDNCSLEFKSIIDNRDLVPSCIYEFVNNWESEEEKKEFLVAEILPDEADGHILCEHYNIKEECGYNCLIVECKRNDIIKYCALMVPVGYRYNMGSVVRKYTNSRTVSVANLEYVLNSTEMEYGSITPIGLPNDWKILVDSSILKQEQIIIGGGLVKSKISLPVNIFLKLPNVEIVDGIAKQIEEK